MKLKASKAFRHGNTTFARGSDITLNERAAKELIAAGYVTEVKEPKKVEPKKADKAG